MEQSKISVIIPTYNTAEWITRCVNSILKQSYADLEIIIVDDGSTDNSLDIIEKLRRHDHRIILLKSEHQGAAAARNLGIESATGDFLSFIDSDDWIDKDMYLILLGLIEDYQADVAYCDWMYEYSDGTSSAKGHLGKKIIVVNKDDIILEYLKRGIGVKKSTSLIARSTIGNIRFNSNYIMGEDILFGFNVTCKAKKIVYKDLPLYHRFNRLGSITNQKKFIPEYCGKAFCTDEIVSYIEKYNCNYSDFAYIKSMKAYLMLMNRIVYYQKRHEQKEMYNLTSYKIEELYKKVQNKKSIPLYMKCAYYISNFNIGIYYVIVKLYYKYYKRELDNVRQQ